MRKLKKQLAIALATAVAAVSFMAAPASATELRQDTTVSPVALSDDCSAAVEKLTIGKGGKYVVVAKLSDSAKEAGFKLTASKKTVWRYEMVNGVTVKVKYPITFASSNSSIASVEKDGTVKANNLGTARITATIKSENFTGGAIYKCYVTVVPEESLLVYYYGTWNGADYKVKCSNVESKLLEMAIDEAKKIGRNYPYSDSDLVAVTKQGKTLRAYFKTTHGDSGVHYYVLKLNDNSITVSHRPWDVDTYEKVGKIAR
ncbi:MAG: Ig-like domain-containing protein [Lachnospiraceae bacterium]